MIIMISRTHSDAVGGMERAWEQGQMCSWCGGRNGENLGTSLNSLMIVDVPQVRLVLFHQLVFLVLILHPHLALRNKQQNMLKEEHKKSTHKRSAQECSLVQCRTDVEQHKICLMLRGNMYCKCSKPGCDLGMRLPTTYKETELAVVAGNLTADCVTEASSTIHG